MKTSAYFQSEPTNRNSSIPSDAADLIARSITSNENVPHRYKALPPIHQQSQQSKSRRNANILSTNKPDHLLENQRRIARFIKHIK